MTLDHRLFLLINGSAGRYDWLDRFGQTAAVFGLLIVLLLLAVLAWWPLWGNTAARYAFLRAITLAVLMCAVLFGIEYLLASLVLHHDIRSRPATTTWATLLVSEPSGMSFPAWPVVLAIALSIAALRARRSYGLLVLSISLVLAVALVYVGVNYPGDVFTGIILGAAIGYTSIQIVNTFPPSSRQPHVRMLGLIWFGVLAWGGFMLAFTQPSRAPDLPVVTLSKNSAQDRTKATPPQGLLQQLTRIAKPGRVALQAAENGHLLAVYVRIDLPDTDVSLHDVEEMSRRIVNLLFTGWSETSLLTIEVDAAMNSKPVAQIGTLFTATIERTQWPESGIPSGVKLPGLKYYHPRWLLFSK